MVQIFWPLVAVLLFLGCAEDYHREYLEDLLMTDLPAGAFNVEHFTDSDLAFTSHYTLPEEAVHVFASEAGMVPAPPSNWESPILTEELSAPWQLIPEEGSFLYGAGTTGWNSWDMQIDENTGDLWVTVYYTDMSGDQP